MEYKKRKDKFMELFEKEFEFKYSDDRKENLLVHKENYFFGTDDFRRILRRSLKENIVKQKGTRVMCDGWKCKYRKNDLCIADEIRLVSGYEGYNCMKIEDETLKESEEK